MQVKFIMSSLLITFIVTTSAQAQTHRGQVDTDGILSPGELRNPLINYDSPNYNPPPRYQRGGNCQNLSRREISPPRVEINRVKQTGNFFGDKVKVNGSVEGTCLVEAGLFEHGRKVEIIPINTITSFDRFEFEVKTHLDSNPEIRVYNTAGERDIFEISGED